MQVGVRQADIGARNGPRLLTPGADATNLRAGFPGRS